MTERSIFDVSDLEESESIIKESCHKFGIRTPLKDDSIDGETMKMLMHNSLVIKSQRIKAEVEKVLVQFGKELKENKWEALGQNNVALSDVLKKLEELKKRLGL